MRSKHQDQNREVCTNTNHQTVREELPVYLIFGLDICRAVDLFSCTHLKQLEPNNGGNGARDYYLLLLPSFTGTQVPAECSSDHNGGGCGRRD